MTVYRLTEYYCGCWNDIKEGGETFDYEAEHEARHTCEICDWKTGHGYKMSYREVTDKEQKEEFSHWAYQRAMQEMGE
jgi:hypothetical protein